MKHGHKKKAAAAKTVKKASGSQESSKRKVVETSRKVVSPVKGKAVEPKKAAKAGGAKSEPRTEARETRGPQRAEPAGPTGFANPALGASYKRASKKYENAFRRLTD